MPGHHGVVPLENQIKPSLKEDPAHENHDDRPQIHSHATCAGILRSINLQDIEYIIIYIYIIFILFIGYIYICSEADTLL